MGAHSRRFRTRNGRAGGNYRTNFKELRRRVIDPAVKELSEKNGLIVDWEPTKNGRKVIGLRFRFRPNEQMALAF
jgi:plasmid replication initiation protein